MSNAPALIVGLGNPGDEHARDRHNAGYWFVDELARRYSGNFKADKIEFAAFRRRVRFLTLVVAPPLGFRSFKRVAFPTRSRKK